MKLINEGNLSILWSNSSNFDILLLLCGYDNLFILPLEFETLHLKEQTMKIVLLLNEVIPTNCSKDPNLAHWYMLNRETSHLYSVLRNLNHF